MTVGIVGAPVSFEVAVGLAVGLSVVQIVHFYRREGRMGAFPVQVRIGVFFLLSAAYLDPTRMLIWVPFAGALARVLFGYCMMARLISLLPWNRSEPFSGALFAKTILSVPTRGNVLQGLPGN